MHTGTCKCRACMHVLGTGSSNHRKTASAALVLPVLSTWSQCLKVLACMQNLQDAEILRSDIPDLYIMKVRAVKYISKPTTPDLRLCWQFLQKTNVCSSYCNIRTGTSTPLRLQFLQKTNVCSSYCNIRTGTGTLVVCYRSTFTY